jgi:hypothetical protein
MIYLWPVSEVRDYELIASRQGESAFSHFFTAVLCGGAANMNKSNAQQFVDPRPEYWNEYSNLQKVKHDLIAEYLKGWFPKLGFWAGKVLYVDTHAGRGKHARGQSGSPLVALKTVLEHGSRDSILRQSEMIFYFIERDEENLECLKQEIAAYQLPPKIEVHPVLGNCFDILSPEVILVRFGLELQA